MEFCFINVKLLSKLGTGLYLCFTYFKTFNFLLSLICLFDQQKKDLGQVALEETFVPANVPKSIILLYYIILYYIILYYIILYYIINHIRPIQIIISYQNSV